MVNLEQRSAKLCRLHVSCDWENTGTSADSKQLRKPVFISAMLLMQAIIE